MNAWFRGSVQQRLLLALLFVAPAGAAAVLWLAVAGASVDASQQMDGSLRRALDTIELAIAPRLETRDPATLRKTLEQLPTEPDVQRIELRSDGGAIDFQRELAQESQAPAWFQRLCRLSPRGGARPVLIHGTKAGVLEVAISPAPRVDRAWRQFLQHGLTLWGALTLFCALALWAVRRDPHPLAPATQAQRPVMATFEALRDSERLYSTLVNTAPIGIFQTDAQGRVVFANEHLLRLSGMTSDDMSAEQWARSYHPEDSARVVQAWTEAAQARAVSEASYRYLLADGGVTWTRARAVPLLGDNDELKGYVGMVVDVSIEREHLHKIERLSGLYATLSQINSAIVRCSSEQQLYDEICAILVAKGGFARAGVARADWDRRKAIFVADVGADSADRNRAIVEFDMDGPLGASLTALTLQSGTAMTANDIANDTQIGSYSRELMSKINAQSASCVAFTSFGKVVGALALTSCEKDYFSADILGLIDEVARDVSFALENIARERQRRQIELELARNEERLRIGLSINHTGMFEVDFTTSRIALDAVCAQLMNLGHAALELSVESFVSLVPPELQHTIALAAAELQEGKQKHHVSETRVLLPDGSLRWLKNCGAVTAELTPLGQPVRLFGVITDITATRQLEERDRLAATVFDNSGEAILITDANMRVVMANQAVTRITGYDPGEIVSTQVSRMRSERHDEAFYDAIQKAVAEHGAWQGEIWRRRKNGEVYPSLATLSAVRDRSAMTTHYVLQETDISMQKEFEARISRLAYRDALTDLPNRTLLQDRIDQGISLARRAGGTLALLFVDLDHFKSINDSLGHAVGDELLKEIARRLSRVVRETDTVGRLGGDEFLVLLPGADAQAAAHVAQKVVDACARPCVLGAHSLTVTPSVGVALYPKDGADFEELLKSADAAMYQAKEQGRNAYRFCTPETNRSTQRVAMESHSHPSIESNDAVL
jgi:diguanylate cyclase (GGDEF)-like protein/PAS domain S-box-containing protein